MEIPVLLNAAGNGRGTVDAFAVRRIGIIVDLLNLEAVLSRIDQ